MKPGPPQSRWPCLDNTILAKTVHPSGPASDFRFPCAMCYGAYCAMLALEGNVAGCYNLQSIQVSSYSLVPASFHVHVLVVGAVLRFMHIVLRPMTFI